MLLVKAAATGLRIGGTRGRARGIRLPDHKNIFKKVKFVLAKTPGNTIMRV